MIVDPIGEFANDLLELQWKWRMQVKFSMCWYVPEQASVYLPVYAGY